MGKRAAGKKTQPKAAAVKSAAAPKRVRSQEDRRDVEKKVARFMLDFVYPALPKAKIECFTCEGLLIATWLKTVQLSASAQTRETSC